jgi:hypothetical protein
VTIQLQTVHVRVNDAATGQPTPARVRFTDAEGNYYAPLGRLSDFPTSRGQHVGGNVRLGMKPWAYVAGAFEINLPPGTVHVEVHKGPEYRPLQETIQLSPGKLALRLTIERWLDLPAQGWYSGDGRIHYLSPHAALLEAQAEDVHVVNLLASSLDIVNILAFSGQKPALESPGFLVVVNTLNTHPGHGSLALLNCHRVVYPLTLDGSPGWERWTMADWCGQCHRKNGLVVWSCAEQLPESLRDQVDAFEIDHFEDSPFDVLQQWYAFLNAGLKLPLMGSSGKESNASTMGVMRTYAKLKPGEDFQYKTWIEAVRAGRTFVSNGPILFLRVNDQDPGAIIRPEKPSETVRVQAEVQSDLPVQSVEILLNGKVVVETSKDRLEIDLPIAKGGWLAARCRGQQQILDRPTNQLLFAHSSPVYVRFPEMD